MASIDRIGIVHLSDLQFGAKHVFGNPSNISRTIAADLEELSSRLNFTPTFLVISGDITEIAHGREFEDAARELGTIARQNAIDFRCFLAIPGNHDVSWPLCEVAAAVGNNSLPLENYHRFLERLSMPKQRHEDNKYPCIHDYRHRVSFLLVNSCERESPTYHEGYVDPEKLRTTLTLLNADKQTAKHLRIAVLHHRLDTTIPEPHARVSNAEEIETLLVENDVAVILSGHVHCGMCHAVTKGARTVVYSGCGSTGVNSTQRADGVPNQYTVHVIDRQQKRLETIWRAWNPRSRTKHGLGAWTQDSTTEERLVFPLPSLVELVSSGPEFARDPQLESAIGINSNPFMVSNAEKISDRLILDLFVSDENRHRSAKRLAGDAIVRGPRGSGKTMFLRYLSAFAGIAFRQAIVERRTAECLPVLVNFSRLHRAQVTTATDAYSAAETLIFDSVVDEIQGAAKSVQAADFTAAVHRFQQRLSNLQSQNGSPISNIGIAINETLRVYFSHILLLLDEVSPVFPRAFFSDKDSGFAAWMNSIRNSGVFYTRVAVYPNDAADILNEERFGSIVNLEYNVRDPEEYEQFRTYATEMVNSYFRSVSVDRNAPATLGHLLAMNGPPSDDPLEQLIYASDGSSRRLLSLFDRCLGARANRSTPLDKQSVFHVIQETANNLLNGYSVTERELAASIARACKKSSTFRFRMPYQSVMLRQLYASREEFNIVKLIEQRSGNRGSLYEFAYPYCVALGVQTHYLKETSQVCLSRDRHTGDWIPRTTTIERDALDMFTKHDRLDGEVVAAEDTSAIIISQNRDFFAETETPLSVGDRVTFLVAADGTAFDVLVIAPQN